MSFHKLLFLVLLLLIYKCTTVRGDAETTIRKNEQNTTQEEKINIEENKTISAEKILDEFESRAKSSIGKVFKFLLPHLMKSGGNIQLSTSCTRSLFRWIKGIMNIKEWAIELIDANGKLPPAMLKGATWITGDYDQCLDIIAPRNETIPGSDENELFRGQYCVVKMGFNPQLKELLSSHQARGEFIKVLSKRKTIFKKLLFLKHFDILKRSSKLGLPLRIDICVPSSCDQEDVLKVAKAVLGETSPVDVQRCEKKEVLKLTILQISCCAIFVMILGWITIGTILDLTTRFKTRKKITENDQNSNVFSQVLLSASVWRNTAKLVMPEENRTFGFTYGIRFLTILWVILCHNYAHSVAHGTNVFGNLIIIEKSVKQFLFSIVLSGFAAVDTFFFLSACFLSYNILKDSRSKISIWKLILTKYLSFTFIQLIIVGFTFLLPLTGSGPFWNDFAQKTAEKCETGWWRLITYVNNILQPSVECQGHLWFLSCLMQLFIFSVLMLYIFEKRQLIYITIFGLLIPAGLVNSAMYYSRKDVFDSHNPLYTVGNIKEFSSFYTLPSAHMNPYGIGLLVGYFLAKYPKFQFRKIQIKIGWITSIFCMLTSIFGSHFIPHFSYLRIIHNSLYCTVWTIGMAILTVMCSKGHGGFVNRILSWKLFIPLGRLSLFAYLLHINLFIYYGGVQRRSSYLGHFQLMQIFLFVSTATFFCSYVCYVCIQMPFQFLISLLIPRRKAEEVKKIENVKSISIKFVESK